MRLLKRFLRDIGSGYQLGKVYKVNNKRFIDPLNVELSKDRVVYNGFYLGQNKRWFEPSSLLLQKLAKEERTHKAYVGA